MTARPSPGAVGWSALGLCAGAGALFAAIVTSAVASRGTDDLVLPGLLTWSAALALLAGLVAVVLTPRSPATYLSVAALVLGVSAVWAVGYAVGQNTMSACTRGQPPGPLRQDRIASNQGLDLASASIECEWSDPADVVPPQRYRVPAVSALRGVRPFPFD